MSQRRVEAAPHDASVEWEDLRQTDVLLMSVTHSVAGRSPRPGSLRRVSTRGQPLGKGQLEDAAAEAAGDAAGEGSGGMEGVMQEENIFVRGRAGAVRQCCCCTKEFLQLDWFPSCTSPDEHGEGITRTVSESAREEGTRSEKCYTICSGRWRRVSDRSKLGYIAWWLNVVAVVIIALVVGELAVPFA